MPVNGSLRRPRKEQEKFLILKSGSSLHAFYGTETSVKNKNVSKIKLPETFGKCYYKCQINTKVRKI
jgi:hypothetical protein